MTIATEKLFISMLLFVIRCRELQKLSEDALNRQPEDVFDIVTKLGEGSYGSVYKSIHKESRY